MSNRLDKEREAELQPVRIGIAIKKISDKGYNITYFDSTIVKFWFNHNEIHFYPYSGWHSGKGIKAGRGLQNLLKQI